MRTVARANPTTVARDTTRTRSRPGWWVLRKTLVPIPVTIVGHSDRYDVAGPSIEERRARELNASRERRESAGNFVFTEFGNGLSAAGLTPPATLDDPTNVGFASVLAGAADLVHPTPASEAERQENRRVKFLAICFSPQQLAFTFGEQLDRNVA